MPQFAYKAIDADGRVVRGQCDALNLYELEARLKRMQLDFVAGQPRHAQGRWHRGKLTRRELITFCFHLEQMVQAGVPIVDALVDLRDGAGRGALRQTIADLVEAVVGGNTLSAAMAGQPAAFDSVFVALIRAGESSGRLPEMLHSLVDSLQWEDECAAHTRRILLYPACVAGVVLAATLFLMLHLVPQLKPFVLAMGQSLPLSTRLLFLASDILLAHWPTLLAAAVGGSLGALLLACASETIRRRCDALKLRLPMLGRILHKLALARFASTFALLYAAGVPVLDALRGTQAVAGNRRLESALREVEQLVTDGRNLTQAFTEGRLFPPLVLHMLRTGENAGVLGEALSKVAYFYGRDVREAVGKAQALIEPLLTVLLGALLGWIMLAVLTPVYDVIGGIKP